VAIQRKRLKGLEKPTKSVAQNISATVGAGLVPALR